MAVDPIDPVRQVIFHFEGLLELFVDRKAREAIVDTLPKFLASMLACTPIDQQEIGLKLFSDACRTYLPGANAVMAEPGERR